MLLVVNIKTVFLYDMMPRGLVRRYMISHLTGSNLNSTLVIFCYFCDVLNYYWLWDSPSLLYDGYWFSPRGKAARAWHSPPTPIQH